MTWLRPLAPWALGSLVIALARIGSPQSTSAVTGDSPDSSVLEWSRGPEITLPFVLIHDVPFVRLSINGHEDELFSVDSGSERTILSYEEAKKLNLKVSSKPVGIVQGLGDNAGRPMWTVQSVKLRFGSQIITQGSFFAASLFNGCDLFGARVAGVLGYDILRQNMTVINYPKRKVMIYRNDSLSRPRSDQVWSLDLDRSANLPVVHGQIAIGNKNLGDARIVIDTGADNAAALYPHFAKDQDFESADQTMAARTCAVDGFGSVLRGLSGSVILAGRQIEMQDVAVFQNKAGLAQNISYDALVGGALLKRWSIVFAGSDAKVYLLDDAGSGTMERPQKRTAETQGDKR